MGTQSTKTARRPSKAARGVKKTAKTVAADKSARTSVKKPASKSSRRVAATTTRGARPATAAFVARGVATKPVVKSQVKTNVKAAEKPVAKPAAKSVVKASPKQSVKQDTKPETKAQVRAEAKTAAKNLSKTVSKIAAQIAAKMASNKDAVKEAAPAPKMIRTYSPPMQPVVPELPIIRHKYSVGETVYFTSPNFGRTAASGTYTVIKQLPSESDDYQYRIKSSGEAFERVAKESQLDRV
jgi:hypothetical protein